MQPRPHCTRPTANSSLRPPPPLAPHLVTNPRAAGSSFLALSLSLSLSRQHPRWIAILRNWISGSPRGHTEFLQHYPLPSTNSPSGPFSTEIPSKNRAFAGISRLRGETKKHTLLARHPYQLCVNYRVPQLFLQRHCKNKLGLDNTEIRCLLTLIRNFLYTGTWNLRTLLNINVLLCGIKIQ